ncbi:hypothetical protein DYBT9275_02742 [Dyadobacter sp. CECT 9275]|uniref:TRASH domain-containing protein n=1 Tax=Dyadobacter helix TaxID=2822344 RepID=A0A916JCN0_9BACT|nr:hypothetical protein [Dyadobacter sp. CECT 9275]CAG5001792.1 hypothetical protein DYBT9275_02742 [Dyadobacter sp. CECT 9275]
MKIICAHCNKEADLPTGKVNYSVKKGWKVFCSRSCSSAARRANRTPEEWKQIKADYDKKRRADLGDVLKMQKAEYFKRTYDPVKAAIQRKKRMPSHVEYCRRPEYRQKKKAYDEVYQAKRLYGEHWESAIILKNLECHIDNREVKQSNNLINKSQKRKRLWTKILNQKLNSLPTT